MKKLFILLTVTFLSMQVFADDFNYSIAENKNSIADRTKSDDFNYSIADRTKSDDFNYSIAGRTKSDDFNCSIAGRTKSMETMRDYVEDVSGKTIFYITESDIRKNSQLSRVLETAEFFGIKGYSLQHIVLCGNNSDNLNFDILRRLIISITLKL